MTFLSEGYCHSCQEFFINCRICPKCYLILDMKYKNTNPKFEFTLEEIKLIQWYINSKVINTTMEWEALKYKIENIIKTNQ